MTVPLGARRTGDVQAAAAAAAARGLTTELERELGISNILLVEDDEPLRKSMARALRARSYRVVEAGTVQEGVAALAASTHELVITDLNLPDGNGVEVVRASKALDATRPVLVLSGTQEQEDRIQAFDAGADDVVGKPVYMQELKKRVEVHDRALRTTAALQQALRQVDNERMYAAEAVALLAHDLNNGLTVAASNLDFLVETEKDNGGGDPERLDAIVSTRRALRRMSTLVKNFVDIARSEDGELKPARIQTNAFEILSSLASIHHPRGAPIKVDSPEDLEAWIDPILLERVIHNLLINAIRYVDKKGQVGISGRLIRDADGVDVLVIAIMNTGPVITAELRASLFAKYRKGSDRKAQSGMGLYFCRLACEAHGGQIALIDVPDYQTCFEIRLPSKPPAAAPDPV
ncbi:MAG TPA: response regulator [Kofleriaceae bacterium]|nr:response regulator [Kofleriaceae bacterium]